MIDPELLMNDVTLFDKGKKARYHLSDGRGIPSVTEILSFIDSEGLIAWANKIGREGKDNKVVAQEAADFGTMIHESIERYLKKKPVESNVGLEAFKQWWHGVNSCHRVKVLGMEQSLMCDYFAGTYDLLISIDDKKYLIDHKTSNHVGVKYVMQLAAYRYLLYNQKNINIDGAIILQYDKKEPRFREYSLDFSNPYDYEFIQNCHRAFFGLVYTYYNYKLCQRNFRTMF